MGSTSTGIALPGTDDLDLMEVVVTPPAYVIGLSRYETKVQRDAADGERSQPGDVDLVSHDLRKFMSLLAKGNPSILHTLFLPPEYTVCSSPVWETLQRHSRDLCYSKHAVRAFLGYMTQQLQRLTGARGGKRVKRPELVAAHGYDTKYAAHVLRLGYQGVEFGHTGGLQLPLPQTVADDLLALRRGEWELGDVLRVAGMYEGQLEHILNGSLVPDETDRDLVNSLLSEIHLQVWRNAP